MVTDKATINLNQTVLLELLLEMVVDILYVLTFLVLVAITNLQEEALVVTAVLMVMLVGVLLVEVLEVLLENTFNYQVLVIH